MEGFILWCLIGFVFFIVDTPSKYLFTSEPPPIWLQIMIMLLTVITIYPLLAINKAIKLAFKK